MKKVTFHTNTPDDLLLLYSGSRSPVPSFPKNLPELERSDVFDSAFLFWVKLRDEAGKVIGHGTEIEVWPDGEMVEGYLWDTCWILTFPARGALYVHMHETIGIMQDILVPMRESGEDWEGNFRRTSTSGPGGDGKGVILGGAGEFAGATGSLIETNNITKYTLDGIQHNRCELTAEYELAEGSSGDWPWK